MIKDGKGGANTNANGLRFAKDISLEAALHDNSYEVVATDWSHVVVRAVLRLEWHGGSPLLVGRKVVIAGHEKDSRGIRSQWRGTVRPRHFGEDDPIGNNEARCDRF